MKVKLLAGQGAIDGWQSERGISNPERYETFIDVFGRENFGVVLAGDVLRMHLGGALPPVYYFSENLWPEKSDEKGLESDLLLASGFHVQDRAFPKRIDISRIYDCIEDAHSCGKVGAFIDSRKGSLSEDKISSIELQAAGFPTLQTHHFTSYGDFNSFIESESGISYVVKPRNGAGGNGIVRIGGGSIPDLQGINISDYIVQKECDISGESRMIFLGGEFLGARMITDRTRPWEVRGVADRKHQVVPYSPSKEEIDDSRGVLKTLDIELGCVDWAYDSNGDRFYLEANGVGTGLGFKGGPYNLNREVAERLKASYSAR